MKYLFSACRLVTLMIFCCLSTTSILVTKSPVAHQAFAKVIHPLNKLFPNFRIKSKVLPLLIGSSIVLFSPSTADALSSGSRIGGSSFRSSYSSGGRSSSRSSYSSSRSSGQPSSSPTSTSSYRSGGSSLGSSSSAKSYSKSGSSLVSSSPVESKSNSGSSVSYSSYPKPTFYPTFTPTYYSPSYPSSAIIVQPQVPLYSSYPVEQKSVSSVEDSSEVKNDHVESLTSTGLVADYSSSYCYDNTWITCFSSVVITLYFAVLAYPLLEGRRSDNAFSHPIPWMNRVTITKLQLALDADWSDDGNIMNRLAKHVSKYGGSDNLSYNNKNDLSKLLSVVCIDLLTLANDWRSVSHDSNTMFDNSESKVENTFQKLAVQEQSKFKLKLKNKSNSLKLLPRRTLVVVKASN